MITETTTEATETTTGTTTETTTETKADSSVRKAVPAPFKKGFNITQWLEYRKAEDIDPDFFVKQDFANIRSLGCDVVRIPIHFERILDGSTVIPEKIFTILDKIEDWCTDLGLYVIYDFHNATNIGSHTSADVENLLMPVWTQMAEHFKDFPENIIFEIMNEPHDIEVEVWNGIIARVFAHIREIDKKHYIICGGADWNSFHAMKRLPDFKDDRVIYTFHFYDPHTFTHQGAPWCQMERVVGIPFPYDEKRMPKMPENPTPYEKMCFETYPQTGTMEAVEQFFDQYVDFSLERNAPVYCGEFGCFQPFAIHEERVNWYRIVASALDERGIARTSWDYFGGFGVFKQLPIDRKKWGKRPEVRFPEDVDVEIAEAMGLNTNFKQN